MNAYFFTAGTLQSQLRAAPDQNANRLETWDSCASLVVYGDNPAEAQKQFEAWLHSEPADGNPIHLEIKRIVMAPLVNQLFTEHGHEPVDWPQISQIADASLTSSDLVDFEQGYWADVNQIVPADKLPADLESLRRELPEEIRSDLNWSSDKLFFFLLSVLIPPGPRAAGSHQHETINLRTGEIRHAAPEAPQKSDDEPSIFPQLMDKKAAALIHARNSVVAAWLWRKFTADKGLPADEIRIDPWCGAIPSAVET